MEHAIGELELHGMGGDFSDLIRRKKQEQMGQANGY